ncbi:hypothetical protein BU17DRAFT_37719 [Hysterangium stoloniferum]|nr:hypothetical protein BU17DRAFT_37719 [Hysterangium stoloniferum]
MSLATVQVHLPAYSHSFDVSVSTGANIGQFKQVISRTCPGAPEASGQRVIYKGRVLGDSEIVGDVWKATETHHVCHLAVHPSAWTATPPNVPATMTPNMVNPAPLQLPHMQPHSRTTYPYIQYMHANALRILARQPMILWPENHGDLNAARVFARRGIESANRGWPSFLNTDFPPPNPEDTNDGVRYNNTFIENLPYLALMTPDATPTSLQAHAIRVLSYTFPLLCVYPPAQSQPHSNPLQINPIPPRPLVPPFAVHGQFAFQIPIRPLIVPLIMLTIRTSLLLYFFQPARKPFFGLMVLIWVVWEVIGAVRGALGGDQALQNRNRNNQQGGGLQNGLGPVNGVPANVPGQGPPGAGAGARPGAPNNAPQAGLPNSQEAILNYLAQINLDNEAHFVESDVNLNRNTPPPSLAHKIKTFFLLLILTLYPAIWDRRRAVLRAREGRVRDEARTREARASQRDRERTEREESRRRGLEVSEAEPDLPPPTVKPLWVAEYVQRVRSGDWVDE